MLARVNLVLIAHAEMPLIYDHADLSSGSRGRIFGVCLHLHPVFVYTCIEGPGESAHLSRLACAFVARRCDE